MVYRISTVQNMGEPCHQAILPAAQSHYLTSETNVISFAIPAVGGRVQSFFEEDLLMQ